MLVLSRMAGESVMVGPNCEIEIEVLKVKPNSAAIRTHFPQTRQAHTSKTEVILHQSLAIGYGISIDVVDIRDEKVRLGISAPKDMSVHRKEVWQAIRREVGDARAFNRELDDDPETGLGGAPVPRNPRPSPDSGSIRLTPPPNNPETNS